MGESEELLDRVRALLAGQRFAVLSTTEPGGQPYASLVALTCADDLRHLLFATLRATRKFRNLEAEPRVSLLIDDRGNRETDLREAMAVTALGRASEVSGEERTQLETLVVAKHPGMAEFLASAGCALLRVDVDRYYTVTRFQQVIEIHLGEEGPGVVPAAAR